MWGSNMDARKAHRRLNIVWGIAALFALLAMLFGCSVPGLVTVPGDPLDVELELEQSLDLLNIADAHAAGITGDGIRVGIVDDCNGDHGKWVTAIIRGVAPGAIIACVKGVPTLNADELVSFKSFDVVNFSISLRRSDGTPATFSGPNCNSPQTFTTNAMAELAARNIILVASAGNDGQAGSVSDPACRSFIIGVGATFDVSNPGTITGKQKSCQTPQAIVKDTIACFSNRSEAIRLVAPGAWVNVPGLDLATGTSASAPLVAGAIALLRQVDPQISRPEAEQLLYDTGVSVWDVATNREYRRPDVGAAVIALMDRTQPTPPVDPPAPPDPPTPPAPQPPDPPKPPAPPTPPDCHIVTDDEAGTALAQWLIGTISDEEILTIITHWLTGKPLCA